MLTGRFRGRKAVPDMSEFLNISVIPAIADVPGTGDLATCDLCPWTEHATTWVDARVAAATHYDQAHRNAQELPELDVPTDLSGIADLPDHAVFGALTVSHI